MLDFSECVIVIVISLNVPARPHVVLVAHGCFRNVLGGWVALFNFVVLLDSASKTLFVFVRCVWCGLFGWIDVVGFFWLVSFFLEAFGLVLTRFVCM